MRVAIYVQHLLGTGHLVRMQALASALYQKDHDVLLVSGGRLTSDTPYTSVQLPVLKTLPGDFLTLLDENLDAVSETWKASRAKKLQRAVIEFEPDIVVIETWPFGRRQMQFEILPLVSALGAMVQKPSVVCSIRDVLQQRKLKRREQTLAEVEAFINLVLIHGERELTPLEASFEEAAKLKCQIEYSGYITGSKSVPQDSKNNIASGEILVSAGGGATGQYLLQIAVESSQIDQTYNWRLMVGPNIDDASFRRLTEYQSDYLIVERNRSDFKQLLSNCLVSVSQFGYNTALDLVMANCPSVVVPYAEDGETEQTQRAACFQDKGYLVLLKQEDLTPISLIEAVKKARKTKKDNLSNRDLNGAQRSVEILEEQYQLFRSASL